MFNRIVSRFLLLPIFLSIVALEPCPGLGKASEPARASGHLHALQDKVQNVSRRVVPTVVAIETRGRLYGPGGGDTVGTGVIISADGLVLSQFHVTHGSVASRGPVDALRQNPGERLVVVLHDGRKVEAEILGGVPHLDISMLRIVTAGKWAYAEPAEETDPSVGERVLKLGHPRGYQPGRPPVVRLGRVVGRDGEVILADCLVEGGDSGGPLFAMDGTVVAIIRNSAGTGELRKISSSVASYTAVSLLREFQERIVNGEIVIPAPGDEPVAGPSVSPQMLTPADWTNGAEMVDLYFLVFIHVGTRRIWVSPCTANPNGEWTTQQARNFQMHLQDENLPCEILQRDRDMKYVVAFDEVFRSTGCEVKKTCPRSPNLQAFVERVVQTLKHEVLNAFCVVNERHLDHILKVGAGWYNKRRGHSAQDHLPPVRNDRERPVVDLAKQKIVCHTELGGHLKSYRAAA